METLMISIVLGLLIGSAVYRIIYFAFGLSKEEAIEEHNRIMNSEIYLKKSDYIKK